jgi:hypothetical protein
MRHAPIVVLAAILLPSCGGGGGSPAAPSTPPPPAPITNSMTAASSPATGSRITVTGCDGECTSSLRVEYTITFNQTITGEIYSQLLDASGRQCGFSFTAAQAITAGQAIRFTTDVWNIECTGTFSTTQTRATLFSASTAGQPVTSRPGLLAQNFNGGWTFEAKPPVAAPPPPPPPSSTSCGGGSVPASASCGKPTAGCKDGTWSCSQNRSGTCSSHGGVSCWVCPGPLC